MFSLYIHIPFCKKKCLYCDFPSITADNDVYNKYTAALIKEMQLRYKELGIINIDTVYFGGGTPSLFSPVLIEKILTAINNFFNISAHAEITLEANPGTVSLHKLEQFSAIGINRLSLGIQAVQDNLLQRLGRIHTFDEAQAAVSNAKKAGFNNISLDLMYGLPYQTIAMLQDSVNWFLQQNIQHISIYGLQVEKGTPFADMQKQGALPLPSEEITEEMYDYITAYLPQHGFERYEISNFAQKGFESRHNMAYWQDKPYLGIGCAAHSYYNKNRTYNTHNVYDYISSCDKNILPVIEEEKLDNTAWMEEFCFLALRTTNGIDKNKFMQNFNCDIYDIYGKNINKLIAQQMLTDHDEHLSLTPLGMKFGNIAFESFLL